MACAEIERLAELSLCLSASDVREAEKLAEVSKQFPRARAKRFLDDRLYTPIAGSMMQDRTPLRRTTTDLSVSGPLGIRRVGRRVGELLMQPVILLGGTDQTCGVVHICHGDVRQECEQPSCGRRWAMGRGPHTWPQGLVGVAGMLGQSIGVCLRERQGPTLSSLAGLFRDSQRSASSQEGLAATYDDISPVLRA